MKALIDKRVHEYYWQDDFNCAVTMLKILAELEDTELHFQVIDAANGLSAGRCGSQCGLVEGSLMFLGVFGCKKGSGKEKIDGWCHQFTDNFHQRFGSLLCRELRPQGFGPDNPPHLCEELTQRAASFAAEFVESVKL